MKAYWLLFASAPATAGIVQVAPPATPSSLIVHFSGGASATFIFDGDTIVTVVVTIGPKTLVADIHGCGLTNKIHAATMELDHIDIRTAKESEAVALRFDVGAGADVRFDRWPRVFLSWKGQSALEPHVSRVTGENSSLWEPLCPSGAWPNKSLERSRDR